jgi:hypothetical protein
VTISKFLKVKSELEPFAFAELRVKFEFAGRAVLPCKELEEVKGFKVDAAQVALMFFSHIGLTVERA